MHSFRKDFQQDIRSNNLKNLFGVQNAPSDTTIRKVLDEVETSEFQGFFKRIFSLAQRGKALESYPYLNGKYLLSIDGTGFFSSPNIHMATKI